MLKVQNKEASLIAKLHPQINCRLELNSEYIINCCLLTKRATLLL